MMFGMRQVLALVWCVVTGWFCLHLNSKKSIEVHSINSSTIENQIRKEVLLIQQARLLSTLDVDSLMPLPDTRVQTVEEACEKSEYFFAKLESVRLEACNVDERKVIVGENCSVHRSAFQNCIGYENMKRAAEVHSNIASLYLYLQSSAEVMGDEARQHE